MTRYVTFAISLAASVFSAMIHSAPALVYFGTSASNQAGIAVSRFDAETGSLSKPSILAEARDPAFFVIHPDRKHLYICNTGTPGGMSAYAIDPKSGGLTFLNHKASPGRGPSHVSLDRSARYVLNANYGGGHVEIHSIAADGSLGDQTAFVQHTGSSVHPQRQTKAYAHWFGVDPTNRFALAADLGTDRIVVYRFDAGNGSITPHDPPHAAVTPGSGPRHLAWHPNGRLVYAIQELSNAVIAYSWDAQRGVLDELQTIATLPSDFTGTNTAGEIAVHANGRFLYASNRGHDSIAVFAIDARTGRLALRQRVSAAGKTPRYFAFDPTHRWLIVSHQDSDTIAVFRIDPESGELSRHGEAIPLAKPMGIAFLPQR